MNYTPEKCFFLTYPRDSNVQYLCLYSESTSAYEKYRYFPRKFETLSETQIYRYRQGFVFRFLFWALRNQPRLTYSPEDRRIVLSRAFDLNAQILGFVVVGACLYKVLNYIKTPFLDAMLEGNRFSGRGLKRVTALAVVLAGSYSAIRNISDRTYLFDLAMKYKEEFAQNELESPNCEGIFTKEILMKK